MGMVFELIALPEAKYDEILAVSLVNGRASSASDDKLLDEFYAYLESHTELSADTDKAWDMMLACFSEGKDRYSSKGALSASLLGQEDLGHEASIHGLNPTMVMEVSKALNAFDMKKVSETVPTLDPEDVYCVTGEDDVEYVHDSIEALRKFYTKAAASGRAVIAVLNG